MEDYAKFLKVVGSNIASIRKAKGYTLSELAYKSEMEKANLVRIEQAKTNPTLKTLWRIAVALDVNPEEFLSSSKLHL